MTRLVPVALLGFTMAAGGCAHNKSADKMVKAEKLPRASWSCPEGRYPDLNQKMPNCLSATPWSEGGGLAQAQKTRVNWSCPAGTFPDASQPLPNCFARTAGAGAQANARMSEKLQQAREQGAREQAAQDQQQIATLQRQQTEMRQQQQQIQEGHEARAAAQANAATNAATPAVAMRVQFASDSADLDKTSKATLDEVASNIGSNSQVARIVVAGHTDDRGTDQLNQQLSERRAEAVKDYLQEKGVPADKIETQSYGPSKPVASNDTAQGRAINRSVIIMAMR